MKLWDAIFWSLEPVGQMDRTERFGVRKIER